MSQRDPGVYLEDIEHYAGLAIRFTTALSLEQYLTDDKTRAAVERVLEVCREALNRLLVEGFVSLEEQKGFRVAPVSAADLSELVKARIWIDGIAITESIKRNATDWEENLILALHRLSKSRRGGSSQADMEWEKLHRAFHLALISGCGSRWIIRISERLFDAHERYRLLTAHELSERDELAEHRAIVEACTRGEGERAMKLLEHHYGQTFDRIAGSMAAKASLTKE